jgi:hypothetical protein
MAQLVKQASELLDVVTPSRANGHRAHLRRKYDRASERGPEASWAVAASSTLWPAVKA